MMPRCGSVNITCRLSECMQGGWIGTSAEMVERENIDRPQIIIRKWSVLSWIAM